MERKAARGIKPKNVPPPGALITLGNKSAARPDSEKTTAFAMGKTAGMSCDRARDVAGPSGLHGKKSAMKPSSTFILGLTRNTSQAKPAHGEIVNVMTEEWENVAEEVDANLIFMLIEDAEADEDYDKTESVLCGIIKSLKTQRSKPDMALCFNLLALARYKPVMFTRRNAFPIDGLCSLLKRDHGLTFKTKTNPTVAVLAANILLYIYQEDRNWPECLIKAYIDDSLGERVWVDTEECKGFVDNIITGFKTKVPPKNHMFPDLAMSSRPECPSPPVSTASGGGESGDCDSEISLECKENLDVVICNRYSAMPARVEEIVLETVQHQLSLRHQNVDSVARNFIRFLSSVTGILEVRRIVVGKLEIWLQSPKLQRPATELLMSVCMNCNTHNTYDTETISHIIRMRIKHKPLLNQYMACLKELLAAHPDNIHTAIKTTIYNELSQSRNQSNMSILSVIFQFAPELSAVKLAEEFLELFCNKDDFHRALRVLFREIVRGLRYDMQFHKFCEGMMKERKELILRENPEICERMFYGVTDIIVMVTFVAISPAVRDNATLMFRGEHRDVDVVRRYQEMVACIQQDAIHWMHKVVPKCYAPGKDEYLRALNKLLMMDPSETYAVKENYPSEVDRPLFFKLASEVPLKQDTLIQLLMIAVTKEQYVKPQDLIELADKLIKRATSLQMDDIEVFHVDDPKIIDLIFNLSLYIMPENAQLPHGYIPPRMAIIGPYWKAWIMLLLITAHNPGVFGRIFWEPNYGYPTLKMLMEMCITNSFVFPPPTLLGPGKKAEDMINREHMLAAKDKDIILEFEEYLAQKPITEQNSLLLPQLMSMDVKGPERKPPPAVIEQLKSLNSTHRIGHLLCRSRNPDFLIDIITRQGTSQSMPWLAELVQSHENAFSMLPVQCLCEFLLSETSTGVSGIGDTMKHQQLVHHLRTLLRAPPQADASSSLEILEYFLRRLSWQQAGARGQAIRGLQRLLHTSSSSSEVEAEPSDNHTWLMQHLVALPSFKQVRSMANQSIRAAIQVETEPSIVSAYLRFLAVHTNDDTVQEQTGLVSDLAQVIVERCTICNAILPFPDKPTQFVHANSTLKAFFIIFINYMRVVKVPASKETFSWSDNQDQVRVQWANGEQAIMHILVIHAIVILLTYGPNSCEKLFDELMAIWFPDVLPMAFLVDTSEEALLFPDWLKLRMIRSTVTRLVDAAVKDLEPNQLVLFIQSFGIPVSSMSRLLSALDDAVACNLPAVNAAVLDKSHKAYMAQLLEVQHSRGAIGGAAFARVLGGSAHDDQGQSSGGGRRRRNQSLLQKIQVYRLNCVDIPVDQLRSFIRQCFTAEVIGPDHRSTVAETMRVVERHIGQELKSKMKPYTTELLDSFTYCLQHRQISSAGFLKGLHTHYHLSVPLFRLLLQVIKAKDSLSQRMCHQIVATLLHLDHNKFYNSSPLTAVLKLFPIGEFTGVLPTPPAPPQYEPELSPFSIANLAGTAATSSKPVPPILNPAHQAALPRAPHSSVVSLVAATRPPITASPSHITSEEEILRNLLLIPPQNLEQYIRALFETAVNSGKLEVVRAALTQLLIGAAPGSVKTEKQLPRRSIALLLDWLLIFDPELQESPHQLRKALLFSKYAEQSVGVGIGGYSQAYLLGAFTQQANWNTLEQTVHNLLCRYDESLNPGGVLDFVFAVTRVPKLWQGREKRTPRHAKPPLLLQIDYKHLLTLAQYVVGEKSELIKAGAADSSGMGTSTQNRMSMLVRCYGNNKILYKSLVSQLCSTIQKSSNSSEGKASQDLLYQLYVSLPSVLTFISNDVKKVLPVEAAKVSQDYQSPADVAIHSLITMMSSPNSGRDFKKRLHELEAALRTMAARHPLLLLRHFHLIHTGLDGIAHLRLNVLKNMNHLEVLLVFAGILELLHPHLFGPHLNKDLCSTLDCYFNIFDAHGTASDLIQITTKIIDMLHAWLATDRPRALTYLVPKVDLIKSLGQLSKEWRSIAVVVTAAPTVLSELFTDDVVSNAPPLPQPPLNWFSNEAEDVTKKLSVAVTSDDYKDVWRTLGYAPPQLVVKRFLPTLSTGLLNTEADVRDIAWTLLARVLLHDPMVACQFVGSIERALLSENCSVARSACERLPDVILMMHPAAPGLLTAAFSAVTTKVPNSLPSLTKALSLLTIHTGA